MRHMEPIKSFEKFAERVAEWQRQLLQLDPRNNLLYFRPGKTGVHIISHTPDSIVQALLSSRRGLTFDYGEVKSHAKANGFTGLNTEEPKIEPHIIPGDLKSDCQIIELQRRLVKLRRRSREWEEEQGLTVLFLALGFLQWVDEEGVKVIAPLLLLPCRLERTSLREEFKLLQDEDEPTVNFTLAEKMRGFGIQLPEFVTETETITDYLQAVQRMITKRDEWSLQEDVYLSTFAYSKLAMWRDLEIIRKNGTGHPIVGALADPNPAILTESSSPAADAIPEDLSGARLDDILGVSDEFAILPADYSQLLAISAARSGHNLVVHGPPGTGKSQTIANIIATFMAEGKSVLFVSEKKAALDVVKRRLDEKKLGTFCLDLHSERGSKANVYQQLEQSTSDQRSVRRTDFDYAELKEIRNRLNLVVRALHKNRKPLDCTVFNVHGIYASLRNVPHVQFDVNEIDKMDRGRLAEILEMAERVRPYQREFKEYRTSHWKVLRCKVPSLEITNKIRHDMIKLSAEIINLAPAADRLAQSLGMKVPTTFEEFIRLEKTARLFIDAPGIPQSWLQNGEIIVLRKMAEREAGIQLERATLVRTLESALGSPIPNWDFEDLAERLCVNPREERLLKTLFDEQWGRQVLQKGHFTSKLLRQITAMTAQIRTIAKEVIELLQAAPAETWTSIHAYLPIIRTIGSIAPIPPAWLEQQGRQFVSRHLEKARGIAQELEEGEKALFDNYDSRIIDIVDDEMMARYKTDYRNPLRRFISSKYRADHRAIQIYWHSGTQVTFPQEIQLIEDIRKLKRQQNEWKALELTGEQWIGGRWAGRNTDWNMVQTDIDNTAQILASPSGSNIPIAQLLTQKGAADHVRVLTEKLKLIFDQTQALLNKQLAAKLVQQIHEGEISLLSLEALMSEAAETAERIEMATVVTSTISNQNLSDLQTMQTLIDSGVRLGKLIKQQCQNRESLNNMFGSRFQGFETCWDDIFLGLTWAEELLVILPFAELSPIILSEAERPQSRSVYKKSAEQAGEISQRFIKYWGSLNDDYDLQEAWHSWTTTELDQINQWAEQLSEDADSASNWLRFQTTVENLDRIVGVSTVEHIRRETEDSELIRKIIERRVLGHWLDWIYRQEPALARSLSE